jgi:integrase
MDTCLVESAVPKKTRYLVVRDKWPRIVDYTETKLRSYMVDGRRRGNGRREYFRDLAAAKTRADQLVIEKENHGTVALNFTVRDRVMAADCTELLRPFGKTIHDATLHYVAHLKATNGNSPSVRECAVRFLESRQTEVDRGELAKRSLTELRQCMNHVAVALGDLSIAHLDTDTVTTFLDSFPVAPRTRNNIRLRLSAFFSFCKSKKWITVNPCAEIKVKVQRSDVVVLSVADSEKLLRAAEHSQHKSIFVPYIATCLFGGLRPFEAQQLDWKNVDFETNHIFVAAHTSKKRESRYVQMEPTLAEWLKPYAKTNGRISSTNFRKQWDRVIKAAGYGPENPWPQDSMRHTAASMLLVMKRNRALVAEELGTSVNVLRRHYRKPITKSEAQRFWALSPCHAL